MTPSLEMLMSHSDSMHFESVTVEPSSARGDASLEEARTSNPSPLDEGHREPEVVGVQGCGVSTRFPTDDGDVTYKRTQLQRVDGNAQRIAVRPAPRHRGLLPRLAISSFPRWGKLRIDLVVLDCVADHR